MSELGFWQLKLETVTFIHSSVFVILKMLDFGEKDVAFKLPIHLFSLCNYLGL